MYCDKFVKFFETKVDEKYWRRKMSKRIEIFGRELELDDARMFDIMIHNTVKEIASRVGKETEELFTNEKNTEKMVSMSETINQALIAKGLLGCREFLEEIGVEDVENAEIFVTTKGNYFIKEWERFVDSYIRACAMNDETELRRMQRIYRSRDFVKKLGKSMYMDVYRWIPNIENLIQDRGIPLRVITIRDEEKAVGLFKLLKKNSDYDIAYRLLETDPTEQEYYEYCIITFPEQIEALVELERYIGYEPRKDTLEKGLKVLFDKSPHDTEEQTLELKEELKRISKVIGISDSDTIKKVDKMLKQFDIEARTFQNIEFETRELRRKAEIDYQELAKICENIEVFDEACCTERRKVISEGNYVQEIADIFLRKIEDRKTTIWQKEDAVEIEKVFLNTNIDNEYSIRNSVSEIEHIGRTDDKINYINALNEMNDENKKLFVRYNEWKDKNFFQKYWGQIILWSVGAISLFLEMGVIVIVIAIAFTIYKARKNINMKKNWKILTLDGKLVHPQLLYQNINIRNQNEAVNNEKNLCKNCGKEIDSSDTFCGYCGTKIEK